MKGFCIADLHKSMWGEIVNRWAFLVKLQGAHLSRRLPIGGRVDRLVRWKVSIDVRAFGEWRGEDGIKLGELAFK